jgi:uncharacterized protein (TIGR03437 family)
MSAQTAANVTVISGNGQVTCQDCIPADPNFFRFFQPIVVKVTDAAGNPIPNKTVTWTLITTSVSVPSFAPTTTTDASGITTNFFSQASTPGSFGASYAQSQVLITADTASATIFETLALSLSTNHDFVLVQARLDSPDPTQPLQGVAGGTSSTQVQVHVSDLFGQAVPNVNVRLNSDSSFPATASCATGAGADAGSVLTNSNGDAACTIVFGPTAGQGRFQVVVGAVDASLAPAYYKALTGLTGVIAFKYFPFTQITVTAPSTGLISVSSGNNQSINPGQSSAPLVAKVTDSTGATPISGSTVVWSVSPTGAATLNPGTSITDAQGLASTVATLSASAVGPITVKGTVSGTSLSTSFSLTANVTLSGLQKVSGDSQTSPTNQPFGQPLVVQVNGSNGQPVANYPVSFTITGPGTLSSSSAATNSAGRAQVNVTAGATQGNVVVTAAAGAFTQSFNLTVIPPGPSLTANGFVNGADFQRGSLSPCSIATIIGSGIASNVQGVVTPGLLIGPLPYTLAGVKVTFNNSQAPIYNVANVNGQQQVTVQIPCDVTPGSSVPVTVSVSGGSASINIPILPGSPGIFLTTMSDGVQRMVGVRPDGSFVSLENPARRGEIIRAYVTGLGPTAPPTSTNSIPVAGTDSVVTGQVIVGVNNAGTRLIQARLAPNLIGAYEVTFQVPTDAPAGNDVVFSVGVNAVGDTQTRYSAGSKIPIQ